MPDIIYGRNAVLEALASGVQVEKVLVQNSVRGEFEVQLRHSCTEQNIPLARVPEIKLKEVAKDKAHQGVVAFISPLTYVDFHVMVERAFRASKQPLILVTEGITDVRNIGAIARSACYFGAHGLVLAGNVSGRIHEDTVKASAGALLKIPVSRAPSILHLVSDLQSLGIRVVATSLQKGVAPHLVSMTEPVAIILGSEEKGLHPKVLDLVDDTICIPGGGQFDSLNVSVATGILLYEANRQRTNIPAST